MRNVSTRNVSNKKYIDVSAGKRMMIPVAFIVLKGTIDSDILLGYETATKQ